MTAEDEKIETCRVAMKAALEAIQDYCGTTPTEKGMVKVKGVEIEIPEELHEIAIQEAKSLNERQSEIEQSGWVRDKAAELCTDWWKSFAPPDEVPMDEETVDACITRIAAEIGARILEER